MKVMLSTCLAIVLLVMSAGDAGSSAVCSPVISGIAPSSVFVGERFTMTGQCLTADAVRPRITMGDTDLAVIAASDSQVTVELNSRPEGGRLDLESPTGNSTVTVDVKNWIEPSGGEPFEAGQIEVELVPGADASGLVSRMGDLGAERVFERWTDRFPELANWWRILVSGDVIEEVRAFAGQPEVAWAQPALRPTIEQTSPNDT